MKKIATYIILSFAACLASCTDDLDIPQQGVVPTSGTYENATDAEVNQLISAVYYSMHGDSFGEFSGSVTVGVHALRYYLEIMGGDNATYYAFTETAQGSTYKKFWLYYYQTIYWCNLLIERLPINTVASADLKNQVIAEARAIRAISMMHLVQLYGNPPLGDHILTGTEGNTPAGESWSFIETELSDAAEGLPTKGSQDGQAQIGGRLTREAAYAYLGKAYLWQKKYNEAATMLHDKVIATGKYDLISDFTELNRYTSDFSKENIWEFDLVNEAGTEQSQAGLFDVAVYGLANVYLPDGIHQDMCFGRGGNLSEAFGSFMDTHDALNGVKTARYRGTVATYENLLDDNLYTYETNGGRKGINSAGGVSDCEGYFKIKLQPRTENIMGAAGWMFKYSHKNFCYMRYAEVLLNYAEAVAIGGSGGSTLSGLQALNKVRNRAGLEDAPALDMDNPLYGVKAERRAELHYESSRFIDLVRWGDAPTTLADCGKYSYTFIGYQDGNNTEAQGKENWMITKIQTIGEGFKGHKNELFPIPDDDRNSNPNLGQNEGW
jgi:hypothetical protein